MAFYTALTGGRVVEDADEFARLDLGNVLLDFLRVDGYRAPTWPDPAVPQQTHLDFGVADLEDGETWAIGIGATKSVVQPAPAEWRVMLDPAGHPFCLVLWAD
jgi:hypothetical protein